MHDPARDRELLERVLRGEATPASAPELFADDLLHLAAARVARAEPAWILARIAAREQPFAGRLELGLALEGPPRDQALASLRAEQPGHPMWKLVAPGPRDEPAGDAARGEPLARLRAPDPAAREAAAAELGDALEAESLEAPDYTRAVGALLQALAAEEDPDLQEGLADALSRAANTRDPARVASVDWTPLAEQVDALRHDALEHALTALGLTQQARFRPVLERFCEHPREHVRDAAREGLVELGGA